MIPLMDDVPHRRFPWVNYALILLNALFFYRELTLPPGALDQLIDTYAFVPARLSAALDGGVVKVTEDAALTIFTAMFLHEGWLHFLGNMLFLWIFGDNVEDALGASGAIAGVLGFYLILYPGARVLSLVPIVIFFWFVRVPAAIFLFVWFTFQALSGVATIGQQVGGGVAYWAHIGGFVAGVSLGMLFRTMSERSLDGTYRSHRKGL